jgi:ankyrin repeat protein
LHKACEHPLPYSSANAVRILLELGANVNDQNNIERETPLHVLVYLDNVDEEIARLLIQAGTQVDARNAEDMTTLHCACENTNENVVRMIIDAGAVVDADDNEYNSPLHYAA